ncbi:hypothetical protein [Cellulomonas shaoxiangyii]|uniref:DUF4232 domain-containing protein n=1 Tax=Cellulomonas shaoxiangyii TaxID=2566013 RepID=A0A4P7SK55_9CELL|nr:hypothetical protein [Cellulomonas shaoxiangyii]QCB94669.1 hypothetical protein E5225_14985 [Cellulomonas shaoxiangyii]TGY84722.1 hypothetical protein E5226_09980 [Cellulomonas shaoxiangyii]
MSDRHVPQRLPARVYWVRRFVVLGLPLLLVVLLVVWLTGRGDGEAAAATSPTAAAPADAPADQEPADEDPDGSVPACAPEQLALAITPGAETFPGDVEPTFTVSITNSGDEPCLVDADERSREVVVTSGSDRIWSSRDCLPAEVEKLTLLLAGGQVDERAMTWSRERSAEGCPGDLPEPGDGTYSAAFTVGGASAPAAVFGLS